MREPARFENMPLLALRGLTIFPNMILHFDVGREKSINALDEAMSTGQEIFLVAQRDIQTDNPAEEDLYKFGTISKVKQILRLPGNTVRVMLEGISRGRMLKFMGDPPYLMANVEEIIAAESPANSVRTEALIRQTYRLFDEYTNLAPRMTPEVIVNVVSSSDCGYIADYITQNISLKHSDKQAVLEELSPVRRLRMVNELLRREIAILSLEQDVQNRVQNQLGKNQREYILREQLKAIQSELGETEDIVSETDEYKERILALKLEEETEKKLLKEVSRLAKQPQGSSEAAVIRNYLDICLELPWNNKTKERLDIKAAQKILEADHYGLEKVKERIIEFLSVKQLAPDVKGQIICLVGPPGVGKTSIGISIARALNRKLARLSLGGVHDEADIRGHRKTYIGAMPGRIINAVKQAGTKNPLILLDEIDKMGADYRGDPASALLEVLDTEQNYAFRDHYLEIPFDLSDVLFITTANTTSTISRPLLDRMEVIELTSYTDEEKLQIAKRHLLTKQMKKHGLKRQMLRITDDAVRMIISEYTRESGVRILERELASVCRKAAKAIANEDASRVSVTASNLEEYLGVRKYHPEKLRQQEEVGVASGLAWTSVGGEILEVEANVVAGSGKIELTGNLGEVMKESAKAAISYIRSRADKLNINPDFYKDKDMHIHFPEGAVPKDGPSAGITMAVAMVSVLTGIPVRRDIAMSGEITLRGRVLPVGGLKEKTMAALRAGIKTVILPAENESDLEEIDHTVKNALKFLTVDNMDAVLAAALDYGAVSPAQGQDSAQNSGPDIVMPSAPAPIRGINISMNQ